MILPLEFDKYGNPKSFLKVVKNLCVAFFVSSLVSIASAQTPKEIEESEHFRKWDEYCLTRGDRHYTMYYVNKDIVHKVYYCKNRDKLVLRTYYDYPEKINETKYSEYIGSNKCWSDDRPGTWINYGSIKGDKECS